MILYNGHKVYMNGSYPAIWINNSSKHIHRLEWELYHGKIPDGYVVHHVNENKLDWRISNLELVLRSDHINTHSKNFNRKKVGIIATKDEYIVEFDTISECATYCGTYPSNVIRSLNGKTKQANGWKFMLKG